MAAPPLAQLVALPLLLAAAYAIYRVGRRGARSPGFETARIMALGTILGVVAAVQMRFVTSGQLREPAGLLGAALSISAVVGLVGMAVLDVYEWRRRVRAARQSPEASTGELRA